MKRSFVAPKLPAAPVSENVKKVRRQYGAPGLFAHHPPSESGSRSPLRMERPRGGKGPRNAGEA